VADRTADAFVARREESQRGLVHKLPTARLVERVPFLQDAVRGRSVVHVGFADAGYRQFHQERDEWLHAHLAGPARSLVGIDLDPEGVEAARRDGYEAHVADCCDPDAVAALGVERAEVVVAGEIIEHLDNPGGFLEALHLVAAPDGRLVITTPNAYGWVNPVAAVAGIEVNHPDHIVMYTWSTLAELLRRHGWEVVETATYVPSVKSLDGEGLTLRLLGLGARLLLAVQRLVARTLAPFVADGLIVVARPVTDRH
jgi:SAM-dependent methyltransferase